MEARAISISRQRQIKGGFGLWNAPNVSTSAWLAPTFARNVATTSKPIPVKRLGPSIHIPTEHPMGHLPATIRVVKDITVLPAAMGAIPLLLPLPLPRQPLLPALPQQPHHRPQLPRPPRFVRPLLLRFPILPDLGVQGGRLMHPVPRLALNMLPKSPKLHKPLPTWNQWTVTDPNSLLSMTATRWVD